MLCWTSTSTAFFLLKLALNWSYPLIMYFQRNKRRIKNLNKKQNFTFSKLKSKIWHGTKMVRFSPTTSLNTNYKVSPQPCSQLSLPLCFHIHESPASLNASPSELSTASAFFYLQYCLCSAIILQQDKQFFMDNSILFH